MESTYAILLVNLVVLIIVFQRAKEQGVKFRPLWIVLSLALGFLISFLIFYIVMSRQCHPVFGCATDGWFSWF